MAASKSPRLRLLHMRDEIESLSKELLIYEHISWVRPTDSVSEKTLCWSWIV